MKRSELVLAFIFILLLDFGRKVPTKIKKYYCIYIIRGHYPKINKTEIICKYCNIEVLACPKGFKKSIWYGMKYRAKKKRLKDNNKG